MTESNAVEVLTSLAPAAPVAPVVEAPKVEAPKPERERDVHGRYVPSPAQRQAQSDEALAAILNREAPDDEKIVLPGKAKQSTPEPKTAEEKPEGQPEAQKPDSELDSSIQILKRAKVSDSVIGRMTREETLANAANLREIVIGAQNAHRELAELKKQSTIKEPVAESVKAEAPSMSFDEAVKPLTELLGEEAKPALEKFAKVIAEAASKPLLERLAKIEPEVQAVRSGAVTAATDQIRAKLTERLPQLKADETWANVLLQANLLVKADRLLAEENGQDPRYNDMETPLLHAIAQVAPSAPQESPVETANFNRLRSNGVPTVQSQKSNTPKTKEDRAYAAFLAIEEGKTREEAIRAWRS